MPTLLRENGYRFFFFSDEHLPRHVHIEKADQYLKIELDSLKIIDNYKMTSKEIREVLEMTEKHRHFLLERWDEYFNQQN